MLTASVLPTSLEFVFRADSATHDKMNSSRGFPTWESDSQVDFQVDSQVNILFNSAIIIPIGNIWILRKLRNYWRRI